MILSKQEKKRLPSTLARSPEKAQDTYMHTLEAAEKVHGDGEAAHRIALGSLKHSFEKVGDHWEAKDAPGPSDAQDAKRAAEALDSDTPTAGGVNANASKAQLLDVAKQLDVTGRSRMTKAELVEAVDKANQRPRLAPVEHDLTDITSPYVAQSTEPHEMATTRTVAQKMGIKPGSRAHFVGAPRTALSAIELPDLEVVDALEGEFDYLHYFAVTQKDMRATFPTLRPHLRAGGMLWLSWPKGGRLGSDLGLPKVIEIGYDFGLVESTCLRVDDVWAGLKFTHPKKGKIYRNSHGTLPARQLGFPVGASR